MSADAKHSQQIVSLFVANRLQLPAISKSSQQLAKLSAFYAKYLAQKTRNLKGSSPSGYQQETIAFLSKVTALAQSFPAQQTNQKLSEWINSAQNVQPLQPVLVFDWAMLAFAVASETTQDANTNEASGDNNSVEASMENWWKYVQMKRFASKDKSYGARKQKLIRWINADSHAGESDGGLLIRVALQHVVSSLPSGKDVSWNRVWWKSFCDLTIAWLELAGKPDYNQMILTTAKDVASARSIEEAQEQTLQPATPTSTAEEESEQFPAVAFAAAPERETLPVDDAEERKDQEPLTGNSQLLEMSNDQTIEPLSNDLPETAAQVSVIVESDTDDEKYENPASEQSAAVKTFNRITSVFRSTGNANIAQNVQQAAKNTLQMPIAAARKAKAAFSSRSQDQQPQVQTLPQPKPQQQQLALALVIATW